MPAPSVFISHASEDKERFVLEFARKLRSKGVDAWVDQWEMLPGDSLVDRIFEEGIKGADAIVVVLSSNSVDKPWVREELNAAFVKRVEGKAKIIPVILDECEIPEALKSTVWQRIRRVVSYDAEFDRILAAIFEVGRKPPIGAPPKYTQLSIETLPSLTELDTLVFSIICQQVLDQGNEWIHSQKLIEAVHKQEIAEQQLIDCLSILDELHYIEAKAEIGARISFFRLTPYGFEIYARYSLPNFDNLVTRVLISIVNESSSSNEDLARDLGEPKILVDFALDIMATRGLFKVTKAMGGHAFVHNVTVEAKRLAEKLGH